MDGLLQESQNKIFLLVIGLMTFIHKDMIPYGFLKDWPTLWMTHFCGVVC